MALTDLIETVESVEQLTVAWRELVLDRDPGADVRDLDGIAVRWADCGFAFWNALTLTETGIDAGRLDRRLGEAAAVMRTKRQPGFLWLFEDLLDDDARAGLADAADRAGLQYAFPGTGMSAELAGLPEPTHPDLTFVRVGTEEHLRAYADLNSAGYGFPLADGRDGLAGSALWTSSVNAWLGLRAGEPVTCAATVATAGRLFVVLVATAPAWQRNGYGEAVTRKALFEGIRSTGLTRATLHATAAGAPVYPRIGFTPNSPIAFYQLAS
ncbi:GNAT family N-acetyltransferase [Nocardia asteroides]|uniref:GNAT family N-acetyltransferase n=1 Tax=Nocardia asteroides TaxID=1824 RepID=UPI00378D0122